MVVLVVLNDGRIDGKWHHVRVPAFPRPHVSELSIGRLERGGNVVLARSPCDRSRRYRTWVIAGRLRILEPDHAAKPVQNPDTLKDIDFGFLR